MTASSTIPDIVCTLGSDGYIPLINPVIKIATGESIVVGLDYSQQVDSWDPPTDVTCTLNAADNESIPLTATPTVSSIYITQLLAGSLLTPGEGYELVFEFTGPSVSTYTALVVIQCEPLGA